MPISTATSPATASTLADPGGLFVLSSGSTPDPQALASNDVDGITLFFGWGVLEKSPGTFSWQSLDAAVARAYAAGKKVAIVDPAGASTPSWAYGASFSTRVATIYSADWCRLVTIPVPWDPTYLANLKAFVAAFGKHVQTTLVNVPGKPTAYESSAIGRVIIDGINDTTGETDLPHAISSPAPIASNPAGLTCPDQTTDDLANWQSAGYTETRVVDAYDSIATAYSAAFPQAYVSLTIYLDDNPPLDANGNVIYRSGSTPAGYDPQFAPDLANDSLGVPSLVRHFSIQNNGLSAVANDPNLAFVGGFAGRVATGYQMTWYVTGDTTCRMNGRVGPCVTAAEQASILQRAFDNGIGEGARFIEVYSQDFDNAALRSVVRSAYARLPR